MNNINNILQLSTEIRLKYGDKGIFEKSSLSPTFQVILYDCCIKEEIEIINIESNPNKKWDNIIYYKYKDTKGKISLSNGGKSAYDIRNSILRQIKNY